MFECEYTHLYSHAIIKYIFIKKKNFKKWAHSHKGKMWLAPMKVTIWPWVATVLFPGGNQSWISLEGLLLKLKLQYFGHLMQRADLLEKTDAGKGWKQKELGVAEDETFGWHHQLNGYGFEQIPGDGRGQRSPACCRPWGRNWTTAVLRLPL